VVQEQYVGRECHLRLSVLNPDRQTVTSGMPVILSEGLYCSQLAGERCERNLSSVQRQNYYCERLA